MYRFLNYDSASQREEERNKFLWEKRIAQWTWGGALLHFINFRNYKNIFFWKIVLIVDRRCGKISYVSRSVQTLNMAWEHHFIFLKKIKI